MFNVNGVGTFFVGIVAIFSIIAVLTVNTYAGKVTWVNGRPVIKASSGAIHGCTNGGINSIKIDENKTKGCK